MEIVMKKSVKIILAAAAAVIVIAIGVAIVLSRRIVMNPSGTVGNTAGNLNNEGMFCEYDGTVYFHNTFDGGGLFAMNSDESNLRRLNSLQVRNILAGGKYLYYYQTGISYTDSNFGHALGLPSFQRSKLNGKNVEGLTTDVIVTGQLVDNYLYLLTQKKSSGTAFYKLKIDKSDEVFLANYIINPACAESSTIYYNGTQGDHYLYALDTKTDIPTVAWKGNLWYPALDGDYVYYMDVANNYRLCRYSISQNVIEILTHDRVDCFNVGSGYVYYQKNGTDAQLICMRTDGSDKKVVAAGNYTHINMTSQYVYFQEYGDNSTLYHAYLGSTAYEPFYAAIEAAGK